MQFASRVGSGSSIISPLARSYHAGGSVAAYLQDQARSPATAVTSPTSEYRQQDMQRLESMLKELEDLPVDDDDENMTMQQHNHTVESLLPDLQLPATLPMHARPILPLAPAESTKPVPVEESFVRVTMHIWDAMGKDLEALMQEKRALETKVARLEKQKVTDQDDDYKTELETQIGKLRYQNEIGKNQRATMARTLSEKDIQIKQLQLDLDSANERLHDAAGAAKDHATVVAEHDHLQARLDDANGKLRMIQVHHKELCDRHEALSEHLHDPQEAPQQASTNAHTGEYEKLAQERLHNLNQRDKLLRATKEKYAAEHTKVGELENYVEDLQRKLNQVGDLQDQLREKTSACDRLRTTLKTCEKRLENSEQRILRASNNGQALRGAAHPVKPLSNTKLSSLVMGCIECYNMNITCDNKSRCRHCTESNETCRRWRCSLKHILGQCPNVPCTFPHDADGWLLTTEPRPEW